MDNSNILKTKAEEISNDIMRLTKKTNETVSKLMENLYSFGEEVVDKTESKENLQANIKCSKGCSYCCYAQISLTPPEAIYIATHLKEFYSLKQTDLLLKHIKHNISLTRGKSIEERIRVWEHTPCIFLDETVCSIHMVRPFICRAWHSLSVEQCKSAFDSRNKEAEIDSYPYRNFILGAIRDGMSDACKSHGYQHQPEEISVAIKAVLSHPSPEQAWLEGEPVFPESP